MFVSLNDILFLCALLIFLVLVYRKIIHSIDVFEPVKHRFSEFDRKQKINGFIKQVTKKPEDRQKLAVKEISILVAVIFIMFIFATKAVFFTAVASGSMYPTLSRDDIILMQNIDHQYKSGDIVMFVRPDTSHPVTHRIQSITGDGIRTAGDATGQTDWWNLKKEDILGKAILIQGKPIVIKGYGRFFLVDDIHQDFGPFGQDYKKYFLFFEVVKIYGYVIAIISLILYVALTFKQRPWQSR